MKGISFTYELIKFALLKYLTHWKYSDATLFLSHRVLFLAGLTLAVLGLYLQRELPRHRPALGAASALSFAPSLSLLFLLLSFFLTSFLDLFQ